MSTPLLRPLPGTPKDLAGRAASRRQFVIVATRGIDRINEALVPLLALLMLPLMMANVAEVVMRYAFDSPTVWAADVTVMSYGAMFMLGAAYTLLKGAHVRTDMLWEKFSDRTKGVIDASCYILLFMPVMVVLLGISIDDAIYAFKIEERSTLGLWRPVLWPFRAVIPLTAALLLIQGFSETLKALWAARTGEVLVHAEKVEI
jgi:TRAP-type mannitol/chloroaromatic compound transport system permease small subunit